MCGSPPVSFVNGDIPIPNASLFTAAGLCLYFPVQGQSLFGFARQSHRLSRLVQLLLLASGNIHPNPGPRYNHMSILNKQSVIVPESDVINSNNFSNTPKNINSINRGNSLITAATLNICSARNKSAIILDIITTFNLSILFLNETWFSTRLPPAVINGGVPENYSVIHEFRAGGGDRGGGIACIYRTNLKVSRVQLPRLYSGFEYLAVNATIGKEKFTVVSIYRQPSSSIPALFFKELTKLCEDLVAQSACPLILGDLNCPGSSPTTFDDRVAEILTTHDLYQSVQTPTRYPARADGKESLLDLVIHPTKCPFIGPCSVENLGPGVSDHGLVTFSFTQAPRVTETLTFNTRNYNKIDRVQFSKRILESTFVTAPDDDVDVFCDQMCREVTKIIDDLAPEQTVTKRVGGHGPRALQKDALEAKRTRRNLERRYRLHKTEENRQSFRTASRIATRLIKKSACDRTKEIVLSVSGNSKKLWKVCNKLLHPGGTHHRQRRKLNIPLLQFHPILSISFL